MSEPNHERDEPGIEWPAPREDPEHEPHEPWTRRADDDADQARDDE